MWDMGNEMNCHQIKELFSEYASGSLPRGLSESARDHFLECSECRDAYTRFVATVKALDAMPDIKTPTNLHQMIMDRVSESQKKTRVSLWQRLQAPFLVKHRALATGFAALALFGLVNGFYPVKPVVTSLLQTGKEISSRVAPVQVASKNDGRLNSVRDNGLGIAYAPKANGTLSINLHSTAKDATSYSVFYFSTGHRQQGTIELGKSSVIDIAPDRMQTMAVRIDWIHQGIAYSRSVFVPVNMDQAGAGKQLDLHVAAGNMLDTIKTIAEAYGVAIVASGDMTAYVPGASISSGSPDVALYNTVAKAGYTWRQLNNSVFYIEPNT